MSYCKNVATDAISALNCGDDRTETDFFYFDESGNPDNHITYNNVQRAGSTSTYTCSGGYCYYRNATQFLTYPPDGIVTVNKNTNNATYIEHDGRVYPVTITTSPGRHKFSLTLSNIGQ